VRFVRSLALTRLLAPVPAAAPLATQDAEPIARAAIETYAATVGLARALGDQYGFATLFYWQPAIYSKAKRTAYEEQAANRPEIPRALYTAAYALAPSILAGTPVRDLSGVFGDDPAPAYIDFCHLGEPGNEVVAAAMAGDVAAALERRAGSAD
jgi:hypothetical protein